MTICEVFFSGTGFTQTWKLHCCPSSAPPAGGVTVTVASPALNGIMTPLSVTSSTLLSETLQSNICASKLPDGLIAPAISYRIPSFNAISYISPFFIAGYRPSFAKRPAISKRSGAASTRTSTRISMPSLHSVIPVFPTPRPRIMPCDKSATLGLSDCTV